MSIQLYISLRERLALLQYFHDLLYKIALVTEPCTCKKYSNKYFFNF